MKCSCGKILDEEYNFCPNCGVSLNENTYISQPKKDDNIDHSKDTVTIKNWLGSFALILIPYIGFIVYFIMLFVWGLSKNVHPIKRNFALAQLIMFVIIVIMMVLFFGEYWTEMLNIMQEMGSGTGVNNNLY